MKNDAKILIISGKILDKSGGGLINQRNINVLKNIYTNVDVLFVDGTEKNIFEKIINRLTGRLAGINNDFISTLKEKLITLQPDIVFINHSLLGSVSKLIKDYLPLTKIMVFFHNVEIEYFKDQYFKDKTNINLLITVLSCKIAESIAIKYSDYIISMNKRDSNFLMKNYSRSADFIMPTSFVDKGEINYIPTSDDKPLQLLFVGFNFYANLHGLNWFCKNVMPNIKNAHLTIVGRGMEQQRRNLSSNNITVVGTVDDIVNYYSRADMIVSPIFLGSGMKTKTAEALMFSRPILATTEALEGYDINIEKVGARCDTAEQFIEKIEYYAKNKHLLLELSKESRKYFIELYSQDKCIENLMIYLDEK